MAYLANMQIGVLMVLLLLFATWVVGVKFQDASLVDRVWGLGFILAMIGYIWQSGVSDWRSLVVLGCVTIWGVRLSWYLHMRNRGKPEDYRYTAMRKHFGPSFVWKSLFIVNLFQALLIVIISTPLLMIAQVGTRSEVLATDVLGILVFVTGLLFEVVGDRQLKAFKSDPSNYGKVLRTGLWGLTRHPNYFGDALLWWGLWLVSAGVSGGVFTVFSPIIMTTLLRRVSGVSLLEKDLISRKPGYAEYVAEVPAFIPRIWPKW